MNGPKVIDDIVIKNYEDLFLCLNPDKPDWFVAFEKAIFSIEMMDGQNSLDDIVSSLAQKYDLPKEELLKDLEALIETLKGMGMLEGSGVTFEATPPDITIQMAWMHITHRCNLRCKYCYITAGQEM
ncbi:MAG: PqqD family peptide modification chaperone, partial [Thermoplasmata archaeon]|nr:PqqD family peptide modification chaperone [Thermoplasmata archaeon]